MVLCCHFVFEFPLMIPSLSLDYQYVMYWYMIYWLYKCVYCLDLILKWFIMYKIVTNIDLEQKRTSTIFLFSIFYIFLKCFLFFWCHFSWKQRKSFFFKRCISRMKLYIDVIPVMKTLKTASFITFLNWSYQENKKNTKKYDKHACHLLVAMATRIDKCFHNFISKCSA